MRTSLRHLGWLPFALLLAGCTKPAVSEPTTPNGGPKVSEPQPLAAKADEPKKDEKKDEPKELKEDGLTYTEKVTLKVYIERQKMFLDPTKDVWASRRDTKDGLLFALRGGTTINTGATRGSVIIDAAGNEYEITDSQSQRANFVKLVRKADPPKKP